MKTIFLVIALFLAGCSSSNRIYEDNLYVTKKYVGNFVRMVPEKRCTNIQTDQESFYLCGHPDINIPVGTRCYVKYSAESRAGTIRKFWILYFTWDGTEDMYLVKQDPYTGQVY